MSRARRALSPVLLGLGLVSAAAVAPSIINAAASSSIISAATARGPQPHICSGTLRAPGRLAGNFPAGVVVKGACKVDAGLAEVHGSLTLGSGAVLLADFAGNHRTNRGNSRLAVQGNVVVGRGATLILGCGPESACSDDPYPYSPSLSTSASISDDLTAAGPLGVVVHNTTIGGSVTQTGGGGAVQCEMAGAYKMLQTPVYSDYEDTSIGRSITLSELRTCWLGLARLRIAKDLTLTHNLVDDPDAIEVLSNRVHGNLSCKRNTRVWDSTDTTKALYPRKQEPNSVHGTRSGHCVLASPASAGGKLGPGPF